MKISNLKSQISKLKKGFTLVELIIAIGIFTIIVTIGLGAILSLYSANKKTKGIASVMNGLNYSVESMVRTIRFASKYHCGDPAGDLTAPRNCIPGGDTFLAVSTSSSPVIYRFQNNRIETSSNAGGSYIQVTPPEVNVTSLQFRVNGTDPGNDIQPYVVISIKGYVGSDTKPSEKSSFNIETLVSQRLLDL